MSGAVDRSGEIRRLLALRRRALHDEFVTDYDWIEDGDKIREVVVGSLEGSTQTQDVNFTHLMQSAPSTTGNVEMLVIEAELAAEEPPGNPHIPINERVLAEARERIEAKGLTPAWEVATDE